MSFWRGHGPIALLLLFLASCASSPPSRFYLLGAEAGSPSGQDDLSLTVGPITLPEYLDRSEIVMRREGEIELRAFERWGEPVSTSFLAILVENLATRTGSDQIYSFRWPGRVSPDYRLTGSVSRFEIDTSGEAVLSIQWRITGLDGAVVVSTRRSRFAAPAEVEDYASGVAALSRTLAAFSDEVAAALVDL
jgi:uncharacterized lipoprotein YmbA